MQQRFRETPHKRTTEFYFHMERFHSRRKKLHKFIRTKESFYIWKSFNSHWIGMDRQYGRRYIDSFRTAIWWTVLHGKTFTAETNLVPSVLSYPSLLSFWGARKRAPWEWVMLRPRLLLLTLLHHLRYWC